MNFRLPEGSLEPQHVAKLAALRFHANQRYGEQSFSDHLEQGAAVLNRYGFGTPDLLAAWWLHDTLEDTEATPAALADLGMPAHVIEIVRAVTDEPGSNRAERKAKTYPKIAASRGAVIIKLADRIANVEANGKAEMYAKEHASFRAALFNPKHRLDAMWRGLDALIIQPEPSMAAFGFEL